MPEYEYKVVPAPSKGRKAKGVKTPEARFAHAIEGALNLLATEGWEYVRAEMLPSDERSGLTGSKTNWRNILIFRRELRGAAHAASAPETTDWAAPESTAPLMALAANQAIPEARPHNELGGAARTPPQISGDDDPQTPVFRRASDTEPDVEAEIVAAAQEEDASPEPEPQPLTEIPENWIGEEEQPSEPESEEVEAAGDTDEDSALSGIERVVRAKRKRETSA